MEALELGTWLQPWSETTHSLQLARYGNHVGDDGARHLAAALERNCALTWLNLNNNTFGTAGAAALLAALETNCILVRLYGVDGVDDILERNRGVRVARKQQVMGQFFLFLRDSSLCIVLSRCCGSARAEAIQLRALFAGIVSVERLQQLSNTIECWLQSNVKDVVRLIARLVWGTKVGELSWRHIVLITHLVFCHRSIRRGTGPSSRRQSDSVDWIVTTRRARVQTRTTPVQTRIAPRDGWVTLGISRKRRV